MEEIVNVDLRNNVANMLASAGDAQPVVPAPAPQTDCYVRCRLQGSWWNRKITNDSTQPSDGFVVRADTAASEIASLCAAYAAGSAADRDRIRLMASAAAA